MLAVLSLLGVGLAAIALVSGDDDAEDPRASDAETDEVDEDGSDTGGGAPADGDPDGAADGAVLFFDGDDDLVGTDGDDTVPGGQDWVLAPDRIELGAGDDIAEFEHATFIEIHGGEGEDTISVSGEGPRLWGGPGDDVLTGGAATDLYGGAGADTLVSNSDSALNDRTSNVDGGAGDDVIVIRSDLGLFGTDKGGTILSGGEGADEISFEIRPVPVEPWGEEGLVVETSGGRLLDFDPEEDTLRVEFDDSAGRDVTEIVFDQTATPEGARTLIQLRMGTVEDEDEDGSEGGGEATIVIEVLSRAPFDVEEVEFGGIADLAGVLRVGAIA